MQAIVDARKELQKGSSWVTEYRQIRRLKYFIKSLKEDLNDDDVETKEKIRGQKIIRRIKTCFLVKPN